MTVPATPTVLVLVGTDVHPFDRLVSWVDTWLSQRVDPVPCLVQYGTSTPPGVAAGEAYLDHPVVQRLMQRATAVVTHGGPTTISEARRFGHRPIVVPRASKLGEHVDDHQVRFSSRLHEANLIDLSDTAEALGQAIEARLSSGAASVEQGAGAESIRSALAFGDVVDDVLQSARGRHRSRTRLRAGVRRGSPARVGRGNHR